MLVWNAGGVERECGNATAEFDRRDWTDGDDICGKGRGRWDEGNCDGAACRVCSQVGSEKGACRCIGRGWDHVLYRNTGMDVYDEQVSIVFAKEKSIPAIREVKDVLIASHTGSGKTYAYLLPIV